MRRQNLLPSSCLQHPHRGVTEQHFGAHTSVHTPTVPTAALCRPALNGETELRPPDLPVHGPIHMPNLPAVPKRYTDSANIAGQRHMSRVETHIASTYTLSGQSRVIHVALFTNYRFKNCSQRSQRLQRVYMSRELWRKFLFSPHLTGGRELEFLTAQFNLLTFARTVFKQSVWVSCWYTKLFNEL